MTEPEFIAANASGSIESSEPDTSTESETSNSDVSTIPLEQFVPILTQLQSVQRCLTAAPTSIPQTFQDQIQFVFSSGNYFLYLYFNNQWNSFPVIGGGGSGVTQVLAGTGISISPGGGTGNVTINCTITDATLPMSNITTNNVSISQHGFAPKAPNDATKYLDGTGAYSIPPSGGGGMVSASGTDTLTGATVPINTTHTITHGLGTTPKIISIQIPQLLAPPAFGTSLNYDAQNGWIYLNGSGTVIGGIMTQYHVTAGGGGTSVLNGASTGPTSINSTSNTSGGNGVAAITINNFTATTFDIVYTGSISAAGPSTFSFPTVTWQVMA